MPERERPRGGRDRHHGDRRGGPGRLARERDQREVRPDRQSLRRPREPAQQRGHDPQREQPAGQRRRARARAPAPGSTVPPLASSPASTRPARRRLPHEPAEHDDAAGLERDPHAARLRAAEHARDDEHRGAPEHERDDSERARQEPLRDDVGARRARTLAVAAIAAPAITPTSAGTAASPSTSATRCRRRAAIARRRVSSRGDVVVLLGRRERREREQDRRGEAGDDQRERRRGAAARGLGGDRARPAARPARRRPCP